jgi:hypothetical protein
MYVRNLPPERLVQDNGENAGSRREHLKIATLLLLQYIVNAMVMVRSPSNMAMVSILQINHALLK